MSVSLQPNLGNIVRFKNGLRSLTLDPLMSNLTLYRTHSYGSTKHTYTIVVFLMLLEVSNFCDTFCCIRIEEKLINHNPTAMELIQRYFSEGCLWALLPLTPMASPVLLSKLKYYKLGATPLWSSCLNPRISLGGGAVVRDFSLLRLQLHNLSSSSLSSFIFVFECCLRTFHINMFLFKTHWQPTNQLYLIFYKALDKNTGT